MTLLYVRTKLNDSNEDFAVDYKEKGQSAVGTDYDAGWYGYRQAQKEEKVKKKERKSLFTAI